MITKGSFGNCFVNWQQEEHNGASQVVHPVAWLQTGGILRSLCNQPCTRGANKLERTSRPLIAESTSAEASCVRSEIASLCIPMRRELSRANFNRLHRPDGIPNWPFVEEAAQTLGRNLFAVAGRAAGNVKLARHVLACMALAKVFFLPTGQFSGDAEYPLRWENHGAPT